MKQPITGYDCCQSGPEPIKATLLTAYSNDAQKADPSAMAHTLLLATNSLMPFSLSARQRAERAEIERRLTRIVDVLTARPAAAQIVLTLPDGS